MIAAQEFEQNLFLRLLNGNGFLQSGF